MKGGRFSSRELERYSRQTMIEGLGEAGQRKLSEATVGVMGVGGLGSPATIYLAAAGVGRIILVDYQSPNMSNLNRQVLHWERDVEEERSKVESAAWKAREFNSDIEVVTKKTKVTERNIEKVFAGVDVILDCLDDFSPRYLLNDFCVRKGVPFVHAAVEGFSGQITTIVPGKTPCLKCLFPVKPPKKAVFPIVGVTAGVFGALEAAEAFKLISGIGEPLMSKLMVGDLLYDHWEIIEICRVDTCMVCGHG
ncbi:MAG: ThiF family adenylyltransferase, partial [Methanomassiliicoccales archaeon]|nr:ThiF family adenylyltransferase [Methanomassiliicoccales archaeon]